MRFPLGTLLTAALLVASAVVPAIAGSSTGSASAGSSYVDPVSAPGPIAGAGLGYLVLAGGYYVVRRWRKQNTQE